MTARIVSKSKPSKPRDDYPLWPHACGQWCKKIGGKLHYFGVWSDPEAAERNYLRQKADLEANREPGSTAEDPPGSLAWMCNLFLDSKHRELKLGEVTQVTHLITVGTPNHGSQMARFRVVTEVRDQAIQIMNGNNPFMSAFLDGGSEALGDLLPDSPYLKELNSRKLPKGVAITVIAGRASPLSVADVRENKRRLTKYLPEGWIKDQPAAIWSHLIDGVGDGAVTLSATRLAGVSDHVTVDGDHVNMLRDYLRRESFKPPAIPVIIDRLGKKKESP